MRAALYHRTTMADWPCQPSENLAALRRFAELQEWEVVAELSDALERHNDAKPQLERLATAIDEGQVDVVVVEALWRLFTGPLHFERAARRWVLERKVALVGVVEALDTTRPGGALRLRDAVELYGSILEGWHREATRVGIITKRTGAPTYRGLRVPINRLELKDLWERGFRGRWLSQRDMVKVIQRRGGQMSRARLQIELRLMHEAGELDDVKREALRVSTGRAPGRVAKKLVYDEAEIRELHYERRLSLRRVLKSAQSLPSGATLYTLRRILRELEERDRAAAAAIAS
jgi:resolvase-like protein